MKFDGVYFFRNPGDPSIGVPPIGNRQDAWAQAAPSVPWRSRTCDRTRPGAQNISGHRGGAGSATRRGPMVICNVNPGFC